MSPTADNLHKLLKKDDCQNFALSKDHLECFRTFFYAVLLPMVLLLPVSGLPYSVGTNASNYEDGFALFQALDNLKRRPIEFWSRCFNDV